MFRLADVLKPLSDTQMEKLKLGAVKRILRAERAVACSGAAQVAPAPGWHPGGAGTRALPAPQLTPDHPARPA